MPTRRQVPSEMHVIPDNDTIEHEAESDCVCGPDAELKEVRGRDVWVYTHHYLQEKTDG